MSSAHVAKIELDQLGFAVEQKIAYDRAKVEECMRKINFSSDTHSTFADSQHSHTVCFHALTIGKNDTTFNIC